MNNLNDNDELTYTEDQRTKLNNELDDIAESIKQKIEAEQSNGKNHTSVRN